MTQDLLYALYICAVHQKEGGAAVPQILGRKIGEAVPINEPLDPACNGIGVAGLKQIFFAVENVSFIQIGARVFGLHIFSVLLEQLNGCRDQWNGTNAVCRFRRSDNHTAFGCVGNALHRTK